MSIVQIPQGSLILVSGVFRATPTNGQANGLTVDPAVVELVYQCGSNPEVTLTYQGASSQATGVIWRTAKGRYWAAIDSSTMVGTFNGSWKSTGAGQAAEPLPPAEVVALAGTSA